MSWLVTKAISTPTVTEEPADKCPGKPVLDKLHREQFSPSLTGTREPEMTVGGILLFQPQPQGDLVHLQILLITEGMGEAPEESWHEGRGVSSRRKEMHIFWHLAASAMT